MTQKLNREEIQTLLMGSEIDTIKFVREKYDIGFKEAYDLIQELKRTPGT